MTRLRPWSALALSACLLFAPPAGSAGLPSVSVGVARDLVEGGRFGEALAILRPKVRDGAADMDALFLFSLSAIGASQQPGPAGDAPERLLDEAIAALRAMLADEPGLVRVRLELARAFFLKGEDDLARRHFERVLAGGPPAPVAANVGRYLSEMRARRRWSFSLGAAIAPDSNIGGASEERTLHVLGVPFRVDGAEPATSGIGVSIWSGGEYAHPLADGLQLRAGADAAREEYERSEFDRFLLSAHLGPRRSVGPGTEASLLASVRQRWLGAAPDHRDRGVRIEAAHRMSPRATLFGQASWHRRRYRTRTHLDGHVGTASLTGAWTVAPAVRADLTVGYERERTRSRLWRNRSRWVGAGVSADMPFGFTLGFGGSVRWTAFEGDWWPFTRGPGTPRGDRTRSVQASVHNRIFTILGFSPELRLVCERRTTNAQRYDYRRRRGELRLVRQF